jgi:hypothetical protein
MNAHSFRDNCENYFYLRDNFAIKPDIKLEHFLTLIYKLVAEKTTIHSCNISC